MKTTLKRIALKLLMGFFSLAVIGAQLLYARGDRPVPEIKEAQLVIPPGGGGGEIKPIEVAYTIHAPEFNYWHPSQETISAVSHGGMWYATFRGHGQMSALGPSIHLRHRSVITGLKALVEFSQSCTETEDPNSDTFGQVTVGIACTSLEPSTGYVNWSSIALPLILTPRSPTVYEGEPSAIGPEMIGKLDRVDAFSPYTFGADREYCDISFSVRKGARCGIAVKPVSVLYREP